VRNIKIGMKVKVPWFGTTRKGTVEGMDGYYIYVRLDNGSLLEAYPNELKEA
jgi:hypothetical protein